MSVQNQKRLDAEGQLSALPLPEGEAGWVRDVRAKARARLLDAGAPARRDEYWKYTNPANFTAPMVLAEASQAAPAAAPAFADAPVAQFVNGKFRADLSPDIGGPGLAVASLAETLAQDISIAREIFATLETRGQEMVDRPLAILNTATATEGLVMQASGTDGTVHIRYDQIGEGATLVRHLVRVEAGASVTVLESGSVTNSVLEVDVAEGGEFHHVRLQTAANAASVTHIFARIAAEANFKSFTLTADGTMTRNEIVMELVGDGGSGHVAGAVLGSGKSHTDNTVFVTHEGVGCESRQVFKNVLEDTSHGVFQGKIYVKNTAQKTDGYQISQSVLLSDGAEFLAKPELEIYADDVACSHGSTTGALDPTALFYLRSRGVTRKEAEAMLIAAFADEAIEEVADESLSDAIRAEVANWMDRRG